MFGIQLRWHSFLLFIFFFLTSLVSSIGHAEQKDHTEAFQRWKKAYVQKWGSREIPRNFMQEQLSEITYNPRVVAIDRRQITSDTRVKYPEWMQKWLNSDPHRVEHGKKMLKEHKEVLGRIEKEYGVDREVIVALWGVETTYGTNTGSYNVIQSLASLAYDGRRERFFEVQLFEAIKILHQGHIAPEKFLGSWSGAIGHTQFMPSSFARLAVDFDGDGKKDIWNSVPDVLASIANYLKGAKWEKGKAVGELAYLKSEAKFNREQYRTPAQYNELGFRAASGQSLSGNWRRRAAEIPLQNSPHILRGSNYMSIMRWNNSSLFAAFVITLMDEFQEE
jgi:membrane-bound lytic murein transglycosylase B